MTGYRPPFVSREQENDIRREKEGRPRFPRRYDHRYVRQTLGCHVFREQGKCFTVFVVVGVMVNNYCFLDYVLTSVFFFSRSKCQSPAVVKVSVTYCHMSTTDCHLSTTDCHLSTTACHLSTIDCYLSIIDCPSVQPECHLSTTDCHLSTSDCHLSATACHLSTTNCHLSTNDGHLSTTNCHLFTNDGHLSTTDCHLSAINCYPSD